MRKLRSLPEFIGALRGIALTLILVATTTALIMAIQSMTRLTHGSVFYLIPVAVAAMRWGIIAATIASVCGAIAASYFFYPPLRSIAITEPQEIVNLSVFMFVAIVISHLATRLKHEASNARQREVDMRDLYDFSRRLAVAFDVSDIHAAIEDHLVAVMQRDVVLFAAARNPSGLKVTRRSATAIPPEVYAAVETLAGGNSDDGTGIIARAVGQQVWLVQAVSAKNLDFGVIAINLGRDSRERTDNLRVRVSAVLGDATATLERLGVAQAINEATMRSQTEQLRDALIGSVSHELRTPLASIMGAATVISAAPAIAGEPQLKTLVNGVHDEAVRLNNDIQNLLDASRISSDGVHPHKEWADPADIIHSAVDRCRRRFGSRKIVFSLASDLPLVHVDPVLVQQALVQIFDNAAKYSPTTSEIEVAAQTSGERLAITVSDKGTGLTGDEKTKMWNRFFRGERHVATTSGSGLGLWIASAFIVANDGVITATSAGLDRGARVSIELPVAQAAFSHMEADADE
jgi:two-component system sensor histidine kinase KdpD